MATPTRSQQLQLSATLKSLLLCREWPSYEPVTDDQAETIKAMLEQIQAGQGGLVNAHTQNIVAPTLEY